MNPVDHVAHLGRRFVGMLSSEPVPATDEAWVRSALTDRELGLWNRLCLADQRHAIEVARRFVAASPDSPRADVAAALLHDIGKLASGLGVGMRVVATVIGPRTDRFRRYHDHERIGADMLREAGSDDRTVALVDGSSTDAAVVAALRHADDI